MSTSTSSKSSKNITSRRGFIGALCAVAGGACLPMTAYAADTITKAESAYMSYEIAHYKENSEKFERVLNRTTTVDENSGDNSYPTAKAVYNYIKSKGGYQQGTKDKGNSLFVGDDGRIALKSYVIDTALNSTSNNPVAGSVVYKEIKKISDSLVIDKVPTKHDVEADKAKGLHHVCESNGIYETFQVTKTCSSVDSTNCKMGVNYSYTGTITNASQKWAVKAVDTAYVALCQDEFGAMYYKSDSKSTWKPSTSVWHT
jgi:hypothetical protein